MAPAPTASNSPPQPAAKHTINTATCSVAGYFVAAQPPLKADHYVDGKSPATLSTVRSPSATTEPSGAMITPTRHTMVPTDDRSSNQN
ncbi:hypothetical protein D3C73_1467210 [compost metagenome]